MENVQNKQNTDTQEEVKWYQKGFWPITIITVALVGAMILVKFLLDFLGK